MFFIRILKFFPFLIILVTVFLLGFLLVGCTGEQDTFSSVYLLELKYNSSSSLSSDSKDKVNLDFSVRIGYLGVCLMEDKKTSCTPVANFTSLSDTDDLFNGALSKGEHDINIGKIGQKFRDVCYVNVLIAGIIINLLVLLVMFWGLIPFLPGRVACTRIASFFSCVNVLLWGLGTMLLYVATKSGKNLIGTSSASLVVAKIGGRAQAMSWTSFTFILLACLGNIFICLKELKENIKKRKQLNNKV